jgi:hypothetical protein
MKRRRFILTTLVSVLLTGGVVIRPTGSGLRLQSPTHSQAQARASATSEDLFSSAAGRRWLSGQPAHWRVLLLHR